MVQQGNQATGFNPEALRGLLLNAAIGADPTMGLLGSRLPQPQQQNTPIQLLAGLMAPGVGAGEMRTIATLGKGFPKYDDLQRLIDDREDVLVAAGFDLFGSSKDEALEQLYSMRNAVLDSDDTNMFRHIAAKLPQGPAPIARVEQIARRLFDNSLLSGRTGGTNKLTPNKMHSILQGVYTDLLAAGRDANLPHTFEHAVEIASRGEGWGNVSAVKELVEQAFGVVRAFGVDASKMIKP